MTTKQERIKQLLENAGVVQETEVKDWLSKQSPKLLSEVYSNCFGTIPSNNDLAISKLEEHFNNNTEDFEMLQEALKKPIKEADAAGGLEDKVKTSFEVLDEARQSVQNAQASLVIGLPGSVQDLYKAELGAVYEQCNTAIQGIITLAKKIHTETQR